MLQLPLSFSRDGCTLRRRQLTGLQVLPRLVMLTCYTSYPWGYPVLQPHKNIVVYQPEPSTLHCKAFKAVLLVGGHTEPVLGGPGASGLWLSGRGSASERLSWKKGCTVSYVLQSIQTIPQHVEAVVSE